MPQDAPLVSADRRGDTLVLAVHAAAFDSTSSSRIRAALEEALDAAPADSVAVDLADVELLSSAGLGVLIHLHNGLQAAGRQFAVCAARGDAAAAIRTARLDRLFDVFPSIGDCLLHRRQESA